MYIIIQMRYEGYIIQLHIKTCFQEQALVKSFIDEEYFLIHHFLKYSYYQKRK